MIYPACVLLDSELGVMAKEGKEAKEAKEAKKEKKAKKAAKEAKKAKKAATETNDADACKICLDLAIETCFVPCGHMMACLTCGVQLLKKPCPMCRTTVKKVVRTCKA